MLRSNLTKSLTTGHPLGGGGAVVNILGGGGQNIPWPTHSNFWGGHGPPGPPGSATPANKYDETKWISVSTSFTVDDKRSIFEKEIKLDFTIKGHAAIDKRNCHIQGRCGLILKTVPAKDGANVVLCTDPAEYPDDMHFHEEFQAKDMHLTAVLTKPQRVFFPLSWLGTPVIKDGSVEWGEILSKCGDSKSLKLHLFVCLA